MQKYHVLFLATFGSVLCVEEKCLIRTSDSKNCFTTLRSASSPVNNISVCQKEFIISDINISPFDELFNNSFVEVALTVCCGFGVKHKLLTHYNTTEDFLSDLEEYQSMQADFVFPILATQDTTRLYGYAYFPIIYVDSGFYLTKKDMALTIQRLLWACLNMWPLALVCILMAFISGFCVWIMETWGNSKEFPRKLPQGIFEGFWWSFVSMTTVGYGDKIPRSFLARMFAVVWILTGITICSLFTASLTAAISKVAQLPTMRSNKVGVLPHRLFDESFALQRESKVVVGEYSELLDRINNREIDGMFMDRYTAYHYLKETANSYVFADVKNDGSGLAYGVLVKSEHDALFMSSFLRDHQILTQTCFEKALLEQLEHDDSEFDLFSIDSGIFWHAFVWIAAFLIAILIFTLVYEILRRSKTNVKVGAATYNVSNSNEKLLLSEDELFQVVDLSYLRRIKNDKGMELIIRNTNEQKDD